MSEYVPYTVELETKGNYNIDDKRNHRVITDILESSRRKIFKLKDKGLYSSELHQALLSIENAILYTNHYYDRRSKLGIYHLPIPEDITPIFEHLSRLPQKEISVIFYKDSLLGEEIITRYDLGKGFIQKELPLIFVILEHCMKDTSPKYFIEEETDNKLTLGFLVNEEVALFDINYLDLQAIREKVNNIPDSNTDISKGFSTLTFNDLKTDDVLVYTLTDELIPYFNVVGSTAGSNRARYLTIEIAEFFRKEFNLTVIGEPTKPGVFMYISSNSESIESKLNAFLDAKIKELVERHFV